MDGLALPTHQRQRTLQCRLRNCANSPASAAKMLHWPDCTVDQYASAKILFRYFNGTLAESSLAAHPRFLALATQRSESFDKELDPTCRILNISSPGHN